MSTRALSLILLLGGAAALPDFTQWTAPGPNDVRSPCPGLNTMANHGIISHDGKGLTVPALQTAMKQTFNIDLDLSTIFAIGGVLSNYAGSNPSLSLSFDLDMLDKHDFIEHDASLSRADYNQGGDDHTFRQDIFDTVMAYYAGSNYTSITPAAKARNSRVQNESQSDSSFTYGPNQFIISHGETALYLGGMGDIVNGVVPVDYVQIFFEQERLPYQEGWRPSTTEINFVTVNSLIVKLVQAGGEAIPEGLLIANNTLGMAILGLDAVNGSIPSDIQALLSFFGVGGVI